ncbi:hypothetical protein EMN47_12160 [Prolixibacteraceae bacterium JC049]|nr:hypothetical protein [Prolixibacteraceae bacterium JC049]
MIFNKRLKFCSLERLLIIVIILVFVGCSENRFKEKEIRYQFKTAQNASEIEKAYDSLFVRPLIYKTIVPLQELTVAKRKQLFVDMMLPIIVSVRYDLQQQLDKVTFLDNRIKDGKKLHNEDLLYLDQLKKKYKAKNIEDLKMRLKPHPISLALAQAALESGWGTSRFCAEANNLFGVWSYSPSKGMKSLFNRGDQEIYVRQYKHMLESVEHYFLTIARARAYRKFRKARWTNTNSFQLTKLLGSYSEDGEKYARDLKLVMKKNNFAQYDHLQLDQTALVEKPQK